MASVSVQLLELKPQETVFFEALFRAVDNKVSPGKLTGGSIKDLFTKSKLEKKTLALIWNVADQQKRKFLTRDDFFVALRLIALAQQGKPTTLQALTTFKNIALPVFEGITPPPVSTPPPMSYFPSPQPTPTPSPSLPTPGGSWGPTNDWILTEMDRANILRHFPSADKDNDGYVTGKEANVFFRQSGLPNPLLKKIWLLADVNKDNRLDREEFIIAMHLVNKARKNVPIPDILPPSLRPSTSSTSTLGLGVGTSLPTLETSGPTSQIDMIESFTKKPSPSSSIDPGKASALDDLLAPIRDDDPVISLTPIQQQMAPPKQQPTPNAPTPVSLPTRRTSLVSSGSGSTDLLFGGGGGGGGGGGSLQPSDSLDSVHTPTITNGSGSEYGNFDIPQQRTGSIGGSLLGSGSGSGVSGSGGGSVAPTYSLSPSNSFSAGLSQPVPTSSSFGTVGSGEVQRVTSQLKLLQDTATYTESKFSSVDDERKDYGQKLAEQADLLNVEQNKLRELQLQLTEANRELVTSKELLSIKKRELEETKRQRESFENQITLVKKQIHDSTLEVDLIDQQLIQLRVALKGVEELKQNQETILQARRDKQAELRRERTDITELLEKSRLELKKLKETTNLITQGIQIQAESNTALREQLQDTLLILKEDQAITRPASTSNSSPTKPSVSSSVPKPTPSIPSSSPTRAHIPPSASSIPTTTVKQPIVTDENFMKKLDDQFSTTEFDTELLKEGAGGDIPDWDTFGGDSGDTKGGTGLGSTDDVFGEGASDWDTDFATTATTSPTPSSPPVTAPTVTSIPSKTTIPSEIKSPVKENDRALQPTTQPTTTSALTPPATTTTASASFDDGFGDIPSFSATDDLSADTSAFDFPGTDTPVPGFTPGGDFGDSNFGFDGVGDNKNEPTPNPGVTLPQQPVGGTNQHGEPGESGETKVEETRPQRAPSGAVTTATVNNDDPFAVGGEFDELDFGSDATTSPTKGGETGEGSKPAPSKPAGDGFDGWADFD